MSKILKKIDTKLLKCVAIVTVIFMLIAHGFCYFNIFYSHDSLSIFHSGYYEDSLEIGRFLIPVWNAIRGEYYPPLVIGILSTIFMIFINYFICKIFSLEDKKSICLISILFCTCSTITLLNATYINYSDMYLFSLLLSVLATYFIRQKNKLSFISILLLLISFAIYPAYLSVVLGIYIGLLIIDLIHNKEAKEVFKEGVIFVLFVVCALVIYLVCNKIVLLVTNINTIDTIDKYNSVNKAMNFSDISSLIKCLIKTYLSYFYFFLISSSSHKILAVCLKVLISLIAIYSGIKVIKENKVKKINILLIALLCLVLPFALNITCFMSSGTIHELMTFAVNLTYVYIIWLTLKNNKKVLSRITYASLGIIICLNVLYSNQVYEKKKIEFDSTISTMNRVISRVEDVEGYKLGETPVVIIGELSKGPLEVKKENLDYDAVGQHYTYATTYNRTYYRFIKYYMGYPINIVDANKTRSPIAKELSEKEEIKSMPCYPEKDSIKMVDGYLIIKFSEECL